MAVITVHSNTYMCGVSKFNRILAKELSMSMIPLDAVSYDDVDDLIVSISFAELNSTFELRLEKILEGRVFGLIVHGLSSGEFQENVLRKASWVLALNDEIFANLSIRSLSNLALGWSPPTIPTPETYGNFNQHASDSHNQLFMFGMSKKFNESALNQLESLISADGRPWRLVVSAGLHENSTFDDAFFDKIHNLKRRPSLDVFFAGFLSDEAVSEYLIQSSACFLAFQPAARANNSTLTSALDHGCQIITNIDNYTPSWMLGSNQVLDIATLETLPAHPARFSRLPDEFRWPGFVAKVKNLMQFCAPSDSAV